MYSRSFFLYKYDLATLPFDSGLTMVFLEIRKGKVEHYPRHNLFHLASPFFLQITIQEMYIKFALTAQKKRFI